MSGVVGDVSEKRVLDELRPHSPRCITVKRSMTIPDSSKVEDGGEAAPKTKSGELLPLDLHLRDHRRFTVTAVEREGDGLLPSRRPFALPADPTLHPFARPYSNSITLGSADGRRIDIRRILTCPSELNQLTPRGSITGRTSFKLGEELEEETDDEEGGDEEPGSHDAGLPKRPGLPKRQQWSNNREFVLACIGSAVGLGNVWRFPYLCYKSGGGAFLIPYFLMLIVCGIPLMLMELAVGQYTRRGPIQGLARICPIFKGGWDGFGVAATLSEVGFALGVGFGTVVMSFLLSTYYNVIIAWALYFMFNSFRSELPWSDCSNLWNSRLCSLNGTLNVSNSVERTPTEDFYYERMLQISTGIEEPGTLRWELVLSLFVAWVLVYFSLWKSVRSSGKVVYFTALFPYVLLFAFLARALTLEGAADGVRFFLQPKWELLLEAKVWVHAAAQNFNSIGIAFGSLIAFASYSRKDNNIVKDTLVVTLVNSCTSLIAGFIVFATLGNLSHQFNEPIDAIVADGPELVFIVYPQALLKMPFHSVWAVCFFFMLLCLGLDSQVEINFASVEVVVTSITDAYGSLVRRYIKKHELLVLLICILSFLCGLPNVTQGGIYYFQLIDYFAANISVVYLVFFEAVAVTWFYGAGRLARNIQEMTGSLPSLYFRFCWTIAAPVFIFAVWVFSIFNYERLTWNHGHYKYPQWAEAVGWFIASLSLLPIPICGYSAYRKASGETVWMKLCNACRSKLPDTTPGSHFGLSPVFTHHKAGRLLKQKVLLNDVENNLSPC
ncbi:unnamed protein product [Darwinula stevensoni]|uniref:Transporter n=1 Tax=Darwinula stevensoni TaxID=69355 RepID=A0A7R8WZS7_9CRUS|nr:unnamed protein product [Darwinula stevensoni]CAG0880902.1 unnamed protein product [Darwinula stevensoni]